MDLSILAPGVALLLLLGVPLTVRIVKQYEQATPRASPWSLPRSEMPRTS